MLLQELLGVLGVDDLDALLREVDRRLLLAVASDAEPMGTAVSRVLGSGKRLRPILTIAVANGVGVSSPRVFDSAAAIELVQIGSLVHDDLFEEAHARGAVPTINYVEGDNIALLAGDFLLCTRAYSLPQAARVAQLLARTVAELCEGQLAEMRDQNNPDRRVDDYLRSLRGKTGVLFSAACAAGVYAAEGPEHLATTFGDFGQRFGMAFQLLDDVLDFVGDPSRLMKPTGIDLATGVYTLPVLLALQGPCGGRLRGLLQRGGADDLLAAREAVLRAGTIHDTLSEASRYAEFAVRALEALEPSPLTIGLASFAHSYLGWALEHFAPDVWRLDEG